MKNTTIHNLRRLRRRAQRGVTLVEVLIVLVLIGIVSAVAYTIVGGSEVDNVRANALKQHMRTVQFAAETQGQLLNGCYPLEISGMFDIAQFNGTGNTCGSTVTIFGGPYIKGVQRDGDALILNDFIQGATGELETSGSPADKLYYKVTGINDTLSAAIQARCVGDGSAAPLVTAAEFSLTDQICGKTATNEPAIIIEEY